MSDPLRKVPVMAKRKQWDQYTREMLVEAAARSLSIAGVLRHLGLEWTSSTHRRVKRRLRELDVDTSHFTGRVHNRGKPSLARLSPAQVLVRGAQGDPRTKTTILRRALAEIGVPSTCVNCGIGKWMGKPLVFEVDHINGWSWDNRLENLRLLCPNCHASTATFSRRRSPRVPQGGRLDA